MRVTTKVHEVYLESAGRSLDVRTKLFFLECMECNLPIIIFYVSYNEWFPADTLSHNVESQNREMKERQS